MSDYDNDPNSPFHKPEHLLDELESLKGLLGDDDPELPTDIPLLDDMVIDNLDANTQLLNLNRIFDENIDSEITPAPASASVQFPRFQLDVAISDELPVPPPQPLSTSSASSRLRARPDYSRDILIQELIDEFVPQIESALRDRLANLDTATLTKLKDK